MGEEIDDIVEDKGEIQLQEQQLQQPNDFGQYFIHINKIFSNKIYINSIKTIAKTGEYAIYIIVLTKNEFNFV
jgi:hypothetical protein